MTRRLPSALLLSLAMPAAMAAAPVYTIEDFSSVGLIDKPVVMAAWNEALPVERLKKLYPSAKWGFLSQVEGGLVNGQTCVVTARVTLLPKTSPTRRLVWEPTKTSTVFDAKTVANGGECGALAQEKLKEALRSLVSSLVK